MVCGYCIIRERSMDDAMSRDLIKTTRMCNIIINSGQFDNINKINDKLINNSFKCTRRINTR